MKILQTILNSVEEPMRSIAFEELAQISKLKFGESITKEDLKDFTDGTLEAKMLEERHNRELEEMKAGLRSGSYSKEDGYNIQEI